MNSHIKTIHIRGETVGMIKSNHLDASFNQPYCWLLRAQNSFSFCRVVFHTFRDTLNQVFVFAHTEREIVEKEANEDRERKRGSCERQREGERVSEEELKKERKTTREHKSITKQISSLMCSHATEVLSLWPAHQWTTTEIERAMGCFNVCFCQMVSEC